MLMSPKWIFRCPERSLKYPLKLNLILYFFYKATGPTELERTQVSCLLSRSHELGILAKKAIGVWDVSSPWDWAESVNLLSPGSHVGLLGAYTAPCERGTLQRGSSSAELSITNWVLHRGGRTRPRDNFCSRCNVKFRTGTVDEDFWAQGSATTAGPAWPQLESSLKLRIRRAILKLTTGRHNCALGDGDESLPYPLQTPETVSDWPVLPLSSI